jgi:diphosphomevalonate decarboxylase
MPGEAVYRASPSLALIKYWGKRSTRLNIPATASVGITLGELFTETRVACQEPLDEVIVDGRPHLGESPRFRRFFDALRRSLRLDVHFRVESRNNFPGSAGLASSSSGFAALAWACTAAAGRELPAARLSALARIGSASAARAVFGGFVLLPAGARSAQPLFGPDHWPDLRVVVVTIQPEPKEIPSRQAMELVRRSSPYYRAWVRSAPALLNEALAALQARDLERLGRAAGASYLRMVATMLAADPPILYWLPASVALIRECRALRREGIGAWETMDAGPQVKILCAAAEVEAILRRIRQMDGRFETRVSGVGAGPRRLDGEGGR